MVVERKLCICSPTVGSGGQRLPLLLTGSLWPAQGGHESECYMPGKALFPRQKV